MRLRINFAPPLINSRWFKRAFSETVKPDYRIFHHFVSFLFNDLGYSPGIKQQATSPRYHSPGWWVWCDPAKVHIFMAKANDGTSETLSKKQADSPHRHIHHKLKKTNTKFNTLQLHHVSIWETELISSVHDKKLFQ